MMTKRSNLRPMPQTYRFSSTRFFMDSDVRYVQCLHVQQRTSSSSLSSLITEFTFYFGRCDQMFVYWLVCLGCLGVVIWSERRNKRLFGFERARLVYIHSPHVIQSKSMTHPFRISCESRILLPRFQIKWTKWIYREFFKRYGENSRFRLIWFAFVGRAIELRKIFACIRFVRFLLNMCFRNFKLSINFPTVSKCLKLLKFLASLDALDHKCLHPVRHVQQFFIYFIYLFCCWCFNLLASVMSTTRFWQIQSRSCWLWYMHKKTTGKMKDKRWVDCCGVIKVRLKFEDPLKVFSFHLNFKEHKVYKLVVAICDENLVWSGFKICSLIKPWHRNLRLNGLQRLLIS